VSQAEAIWEPPPGTRVFAFDPAFDPAFAGHLATCTIDWPELLFIRVPDCTEFDEQGKCLYSDLLPESCAVHLGHKLHDE
jgi:hypothetical protein